MQTFPCNNFCCWFSGDEDKARSTVTSCPEMKAESGNKRNANGQAILLFDSLAGEGDDSLTPFNFRTFTVVPFKPISLAKDRVNEESPEDKADVTRTSLPFMISEEGTFVTNTIRPFTGTSANADCKTLVASVVTSLKLSTQVASITMD